MKKYEKLNFIINYAIYPGDRHPLASIFIGDKKKIEIKNSMLNQVNFSHYCQIGKINYLTIYVNNVNYTSTLAIPSIFIDGINVNEILNAYKTYEIFDSVDRQDDYNQDLNDRVYSIGGILRFPFYNPFYKFVIDWVKNETNM